MCLIYGNNCDLLSDSMANTADISGTYSHGSRCRCCQDRIDAQVDSSNMGLIFPYISLLAWPTCMSSPLFLVDCTPYRKVEEGFGVHH